MTREDFNDKFRYSFKINADFLTKLPLTKIAQLRISSVWNIKVWNLNGRWRRLWHHFTPNLVRICKNLIRSLTQLSHFYSVNDICFKPQPLSSKLSSEKPQCLLKAWASKYCRKEGDLLFLMFFSWYLAIQLKLPSLKRWVGFTWIMQEGEDTLPLPHNHWVFRSWQQCLFTSENWQIGRKLADLMLPNYGRWVGSQIPTLENRKFNSWLFWNFSKAFKSRITCKVLYMTCHDFLLYCQSRL